MKDAEGGGFIELVSVLIMISVGMNYADKRISALETRITALEQSVNGVKP